MAITRNYVLSIAGIDPSGGAGLLADIKTFEQHKVYGLGVATAQTIQTEDQFFCIKWEMLHDILQSTSQMLQKYPVKVVKIGIVQNVHILSSIVTTIHRHDKGVKIIIDPIVKSSTGFSFWEDISMPALLATLDKVTLVTPNYREISAMVSDVTAQTAAKQLAKHCAVLLKGGHNEQEPGTDYLFEGDTVYKIEKQNEIAYDKHGSGCVVSAAIAAHLALGEDLLGACTKGKTYVEAFLASNSTLLGYHHV